MTKNRIPRSVTKFCPRVKCMGRLKYFGNNRKKPWTCQKCGLHFDKKQLLRKWGNNDD